MDVVDGMLAPISLRANLSTPTTMTERDPDRIVDNLVAVTTQRAAD